MTTMYEEDFESYVCGTKSNHMAIGSTNSFGSPDLDTRPPEMARSTIYQFIQRCPLLWSIRNRLEKIDNRVQVMSVPEQTEQSKIE